MGNRWSVKTYTFTKSGGSIVLNTLTLDGYLVSGKLTKTFNDTSKVNFVVPDAQGKDLFPGQTLVDVKYGNDNNWERKFFGTVVKRVYDSESGLYSFEVTGVLGSYQFIPNYDNYGIETIETYIATEMSRFKGTASAPYDCANPWDELYTGHDEIPSTFGDIETENLSLIPAFNLKLQKTCTNAYEFLKQITRNKNYVFPSLVDNKSSLCWYEEGEKAFFKRRERNGRNVQTVSYNDNLLSYTLDRRTTATKVYVENTVDVYPQYTGWETGSYPTPFNYKRVVLSPKSDKSAYTLDEMLDEASRLLPSTSMVEAYAFDKHLIDESVPWFDISKNVTVYMFINGEQYVRVLDILQIVYDFCDSSKDRVKLGDIDSNSLTVSTEQQNKDFEADIKGKLDTSGGEMSGSIVYNDTTNDINTTNTISGDEIHLTRKDNSASSSSRVIESAVDIVPLGVVPGFSDIPINNQPYVSATRKYGTSSATATKLTTTLNGIGFSSVERDSSDNFKKGTVINPDSLTLMGSPHRISASSNEIRMDDDRYALTCNLLDSALIEQGRLSGADGSETALTSGIRSGRSKVSSSTAYTVHWSGALRLYIFEYTSAGAFIKYTLYSNAAVESATFTTTSTTGIVRFMWEYTNGSTITPSAISNVQLERGSQASSFVPYTMDGVEVAERLNYKLNYFTPQNCSARDVFGNCFYFKENGMVHIHIGANNPTGLNTLYQIGQLPSDCYPLGYASVLGHEGSELLVSDTGLMRFVAKSTDIIIDLVFKAKN